MFLILSSFYIMLVLAGERNRVAKLEEALKIKEETLAAEVEARRKLEETLRRMEDGIGLTEEERRRQEEERKRKEEERKKLEEEKRKLSADLLQTQFINEQLKAELEKLKVLPSILVLFR